jgi:hypothetical protein
MQHTNWTWKVGIRTGIRTTASEQSGVYWSSSFVPSTERSTCLLPFEDFVPMYRGRIKEGNGKLDSSDISSIRLMLSKSANPKFVETGAFSLCLFNIAGVLK